MLCLLLTDNVRAARQDVINVMHDLNDLQLGRFLTGRRKSPSRFEWSISAGSVARAAQGEADEILPFSPAAPAGKEKERQTRDAIREFSFPLRRDFSIDFTLPLDLTTVEAERISAFLKTLPITSEPENVDQTGSQ